MNDPASQGMAATLRAERTRENLEQARELIKTVARLVHETISCCSPDEEDDVTQAWQLLAHIGDALDGKPQQMRWASTAHQLLEACVQARENIGDWEDLRVAMQ